MPCGCVLQVDLFSGHVNKVQAGPRCGDSDKSRPERDRYVVQFVDGRHCESRTVLVVRCESDGLIDRFPVIGDRGNDLTVRVLIETAVARASGMNVTDVRVIDPIAPRPQYLVHVER